MSISGSNPVPKIQSEQILENELVAQLISQGYARAAVTDEESMLANLKAQLEAFNGVTLTAGESTKVMHHLNKSAGVFAKAKILRDRMKLEKEGRDDGLPLVFRFMEPTTEPLSGHPAGQDGGHLPEPLRCNDLGQWPTISTD
jgi:hypothetical protein